MTVKSKGKLIVQLHQDHKVKWHASKCLKVQCFFFFLLRAVPFLYSKWRLTHCINSTNKLKRLVVLIIKGTFSHQLRSHQHTLYCKFQLHWAEMHLWLHPYWAAAQVCYASRLNYIALMQRTNITQTSVPLACRASSTALHSRVRLLKAEKC